MLCLEVAVIRIGRGNERARNIVAEKLAHHKVHPGWSRYWVHECQQERGAQMIEWEHYTNTTVYDKELTFLEEKY